MLILDDQYTFLQVFDPSRFEEAPKKLVDGSLEGNLILLTFAGKKTGRILKMAGKIKHKYICPEHKQN